MRLHTVLLLLTVIVYCLQQNEVVDNANLENLLAALFHSSQDLVSTTWLMCTLVQLLNIGTQAYPLHISAVYM